MAWRAVAVKCQVASCFADTDRSESDIFFYAGMIPSKWRHYVVIAAMAGWQSISSVMDEFSKNVKAAVLVSGF